MAWGWTVARALARAVRPSGIAAAAAGLLALAPGGASAEDAAPCDAGPEVATKAGVATLGPLLGPLTPCAPRAALPPGALPRPMPPELEGSRAPRWRPSYALPAVESAAFNLGLVGWNRWVGNARWANVTLATPFENLRSSWGLDDDQYWVNQFGHPYQGSFTHQAARSAGLGFWRSAGYVLVASTVWELAGETERPSLNDQSATVLGGAALGEVLHRLAATLHEGGGTAGRAFALLLDPFQALNRSLLGAPPRPDWPALRWSVGAGPVLRDDVGEGKTSLTARLAARAEGGLPGDPDLRLRQPFDHFVLEAAYGAATDPQVTLRTRGLLLGETFDIGARGGGLWGLFLSLDFDTPGPFRTATTGIGVGASARVGLPAGLALEGTALASAIPLGAAGRIGVAPGLEERDYALGPGASAVTEVALVAGDRLRALLSFRPCAILAAEGRQADVLVLDAGANLFVRVAGGQGLGAEVVGRRHLDRGPEGAVRRGSGGAVHVYWGTSGGALSLAT